MSLRILIVPLEGLVAVKVNGDDVTYESFNSTLISMSVSS